MGVGWRRFTERIHQGAPIGGGADFQPTSNARCSATLREAADFTAQLHKCLKAIRAMAAANADAAGTIKTVMGYPLPRIYEETAVAAGGATAGLSTVGGDAFSPEAVSRAMQDAGHKIEVEVVAPLNRWQDVYVQLNARYRELENVRLEVDSRRRTVGELSHKVDSLRARLGKGSDAGLEARLEQTIKQLQHKEGKLQVAAASYREQEVLLYRDLTTLVRDTQYLKHYAAAALRLEGLALLSSAEAFGDLPSRRPPAAELAQMAGAPAAVPAMEAGLHGDSKRVSLTAVPASEAAAGGHVTLASSPASPRVQPEMPLARFPVVAVPGPQSATPSTVV